MHAFPCSVHTGQGCVQLIAGLSQGCIPRLMCTISVIAQVVRRRERKGARMDGLPASGFLVDDSRLSYDVLLASQVSLCQRDQRLISA